MKKNDVLWGYFFILPSLLIIGLFLIYPLIQTFVISLFHANLDTFDFVGVRNYAGLLHDKVFNVSLFNTFFYVLLIVPMVVVMALVIAALMQGLHEKGKSLFRLVYYLPVVSTPVVVAMVWNWMYQPSFGIINYLLHFVGLGPYTFFSDQTTGVICLSFIVITWMVGQPVILYLASMDAIPGDLFSAAQIDGANRIQMFFKITVPLIVHTTLLIVITSTIGAFQVFVVILLITGGGPFHGTESLVFTIYQTAFVSFDYGKACAQSVVLFLIILAIALIQFRLLRTDL